MARWGSRGWWDWDVVCGVKKGRKGYLKIWHRYINQLLFPHHMDPLDEILFEPYLAKGEKIQDTFRPSRRPRILGYVASVVAAIGGFYMLGTFAPEVIDGFREGILADREKSWKFLGKILVAATGLFMGLSGADHIIESELELYATRYALTTQRILKKTGLFRKDVESVQYKRVTDTAVTQGITERLTHTGTVHISTAGSQGYEMELATIPALVEVSRAILDYAKK